jgi:hypothetical protein
MKKLIMLKMKPLNFEPISPVCGAQTGTPLEGFPNLRGLNLKLETELET